MNVSPQSLQNATFRPRRSCLYMPGINARALEKARTLAADAVIFDLEDAVAPEEKTRARDMVCAAVAAGGFGQRETVIRINGLDSEWGKDDLHAALAVKPDTILVPKINAAADIMRAHALVTGADADSRVHLWAMIETPRAILAINAIAAAAEKARLTAFIMGTNDLAKDMRISPTPDRSAFYYALGASIMAARAHNITIIDGVYNAIKNTDGFILECEQGKQFGFDGKTLIHPAQIEACNRIFSPDREAIAHAHRIVAAFADPANVGKGVVSVDGQMTELLHLEGARRLLAMEKALSS